MKKIQLNQGWLFSERDIAGQVSVDLPHDFIITKPRHPQAPGSHANGYFGQGVGVYEKTLDIPQEWCQQQVLLDIDGAYMNAEIWLNGELLALHPYGYTPFLVDLSPVLHPGKNRLKIVTQSLQPSTRWYCGGGLYRSVNLWVGDRVSIHPWDTFVTTPCITSHEAEVCIESSITSTHMDTQNVDVLYQVYNEKGVLCAESKQRVQLLPQGKTSVQAMLTLADPVLWEIGDAYLYTLKVTLSRTEEILDSSTVSFGVRSIAISPERGFELNGRPLKLKGGCIHHDNGLLGACAYPRAEERKIQILMEAGFNAVRISHYPPSSAMLEVCDRLGMLLLDEAFDCFRIGMAPLDYHLYFEDWWERDIESMVLRDRNHPCVITYSIGNEIIERDGRSNGALWSRKLADKVRSLDDTRFVLSALHNLWPDPETEDQVTALDANNLQDAKSFDLWGTRTQDFVAPLDIVGYNYLYERYAQDRKLFPQRVICGTESHPFYAWRYWQGVLDNTHVIGDFTWVAMDNLGEVGVGRVEWNAEGKVPFFGAYPWRSCWQGDHDLCGFRRPLSHYRKIMWGDQREPALFTTHPKHYGQTFSGTGWHWYDVQDCWTFPEEYIGKPVPVQVYGQGDEAAFFLNGKEVARTSIQELIGQADILYQPGILKVIVYQAGEIWGQTQLETVGSPCKIRLRADRRTISADRQDLCYITVEIVDAHGRRVPMETSHLFCAVSAPGVLAGFGSADPTSEDAFGTWQCHAFEGRALAIIKASAPGPIAVTVAAEALLADTLHITALEANETEAM